MPKNSSKSKKSVERAALDSELFAIDDEGDASTRQQVLSSWDASPAAAGPRKGSGKPLKSEQILAMRSRVPARTSRAQPASLMHREKLAAEKRNKIDPEVKRRLRGMVHRRNTDDRGLWDVTTQKNEQELSEAAKSAGDYDVWSVNTRAEPEEKDVYEEIRQVVEPAKPKAPSTLHKHALLSSLSNQPSAISLPHPGESYNPTFSDHQALLAAEHEKALLQEESSNALTLTKKAIMNGRMNAPVGNEWESGYANEVGSGEEDSDNEDETEQEKKARKQKKRKTDKEKAKRRANIQLDASLRANSALSKSQRQALSQLTTLNSSLASKSSISLSLLHKRKTALANRLSSSGLATLRSGPGRVPVSKQAYLLSEELPESLRELRTDKTSNLWNEWLDSSRRRGKIQMERDSSSRMRKQKNRSWKEKEKVAWRMFEREQ